jgi:zinc protease
MTTRPLATAFTAALALSLLSPPLRAAPVESFTLPNGLRVALQEDHRSPHVAVVVSYGVGWRDGPPGFRGLPHFFEHLMFQGSRHAPSDEFWNWMEIAGASQINATTEPDQTVYREVVPSNRLDGALWLESDRMGFVLDQLTEASVESVRRVVLNEWQERVGNTATGRVGWFLADALYPPGHPYREPGDHPDDLQAIHLSQVLWFGERWYRPDNAVLSLVGTAPPQVTLSGEVQLEVEALQHAAELMVAWPAPAALSPDDAALEVLARILANGDRGRLIVPLQRDRAVASRVGASEVSTALASVFAIEATGELEEKPETMLELVDEELDRLRQSDVDPHELDAVVREIVATKAASGSDLLHRATRMPVYWRGWGAPDGFDRDLDRYRRVTPTDVRRVANEVLNPRARIVAFIRRNNLADPGGTLAHQSVR